jgi:colanic acid/amylovoran biosynthesis protein
MRILVEPGCFDCLNMGDVAMLEVLVNRLHELWPQATIQVPADLPEERLLAHCPTAKPIDALGRYIWFQDGCLFSPLHKLSSGSRALSILNLERTVRRRYPDLLAKLLRIKTNLLRQDSSSLKKFLEAVSEADLIVVAGQGSINDIFHAHALNVLDVLGMAIRRRIPTAMFSQGLGPLNDPIVRTRAKEVLPEVKVLALREVRAALPLLDSLGIDSSQVMVTGDDAIEHAYNERPKELGNAIGINVRVSDYADVDDDLLAKIRSVLPHVAKKHDAPIVPVPISIDDEISDASRIRQLVGDYDRYEGDGKFETSLQVIRQVGRCRTVFAGSYHAAVFALAQGIPTVCLASSDYYFDKFTGLSDQFGDCCTVLTNDSQFAEKLESALDDAYSLAESERPVLLEAAAKQIAASRAAYRALYDQVSRN